MVQSLEWYATQSFNNNWLVGRVHFDVTPCDMWHGKGDEYNDDIDEMIERYLLNPAFGPLQMFDSHQ